MVGGSQGLHVELAGGVFHPRRGHGIDLELGIVGGGAHQSAPLPGGLNDGCCQSGTLHRIGARPQLVKKDEGTRPARLQDPHDVGHVRGEGGQVLCNGLLIADVGQHVVKDHNAAVVPHRDVQATLGHEDE